MPYDAVAAHSHTACREEILAITRFRFPVYAKQFRNFDESEGENRSQKRNLVRIFSEEFEAIGPVADITLLFVAVLFSQHRREETDH